MACEKKERKNPLTNKQKKKKKNEFFFRSYVSSIKTYLATLDCNLGVSLSTAAESIIDEIGEELPPVMLGVGVATGNGGIEGDGDGVTLLDSDNLSYLSIIAKDDYFIVRIRIEQKRKIT